MIFNYRVEICRNCYFKRTHQCPFSSNYIQNFSAPHTKEGGECLKNKPIPWLPEQ